MIAFASSITSPEMYQRCAEPGVRLASEPDSEILARPARGSIFASYNALLDEAAALPDLEGLVLLHQDSEIVEDTFCTRLREALADPAVGVVGCVGAVGVRSIAWWDGAITWASFIHRYPELQGADLPSLTWGPVPTYGHTGEVDTVDGFVLALSPWVVRNIRFDEDLGQPLHGYDFDFCLQVREAGRKIATANFRVIHHHSLMLGSDLPGWAEAHVTIAEKWQDRMPGVGDAPGTWRERARRAEAEAAVVRAETAGRALRVRAIKANYRREREIMSTSIGWRLTAPLRALHALPRPVGRPAPAEDEGRVVIGRRLRRRMAGGRGR